MPELPFGQVTFVFTDIEGSTRLVQEIGPERYAPLLAQHSGILRAAMSEHGGIEFGSEGDAHFFAFGTSVDAVRGAVDAQRALAAAPWPAEHALRVRMGVHTGSPELREGQYVGVDLSRVARITAAGHGGQILASESAISLIGVGQAPAGFVDLGDHRLKDLNEPQHLFQVVVPGLPSDFPPIRSIDTRPKVLPAPVASFVGRGEELARIGSLVVEHRLVTLTGPGGSGKTRLAIAAADRALPSFEDGVFFVPLASVRDPDMVAVTAATVLGVRETPEQPIRAALGDFLRTRRLLLALDNFEHVLPASPVVGELLAEAGGLHVLVTSRILLHVYGEQEYAVPPLPVPLEASSYAELMANPAVALFVDRAAAASPGFRLTADDAPIIAEVCRRLDGLPLAIELAAARIRILSPTELAARLERRLATLVGSTADLPERQRTLRGTIEWSHDLLDPIQRTLFARLSAFDGGWGLDAAEAVAGERLGGDVADVLGQLVDQSLVQRDAADGSAPRFSMLETIREFAIERLGASGEASEVVARHAAYYLELAQEAEPGLTGEEAGDWGRRLGREVDNLRAALRWSLASPGSEDGGDAEIESDRRVGLGLDLASAIWRYWQQAGTLSEGRDWLDRLLDRATQRAPDAALVRALIAAGGIAYWQTDYEVTFARYEAAGGMAQAIGDVRLQAEAVDNLAYVALFRGDPARARELMARARDLWLEAGDRFRAALADALGDFTYLYEGHPADAIPAQERMIAEARRTGERYWLMNGLTGLGQLHRALGNIGQARGFYAEALAMALEDGNLAMLTMALDPLSNLELAAGEPERAVRLWAASATLRHQMGGGAPGEFMMVADPRQAATALIGDEAVRDAWAAGRAMSAADAVAEAQSLTNDAGVGGSAGQRSDVKEEARG